jgi:class 3 adenylate cyclase
MRSCAPSVARYRGREVKTMGDGFLLTFDAPARAVRCAQEIASGVRALGIEVRAGLHTGEIEMDGSDIAGIAVAIAARVSALAGAGEVLVSGTIRDLTAGATDHLRRLRQPRAEGDPGHVAPVRRLVTPRR